ncbi:MAG: helix-turn-helix domain-containing protein [Verrucomicrobia bacterium]|nr:helix-turn-helix domain-containing protein [Verrucomicrobiota bacterium]
MDWRSDPFPKILMFVGGEGVLETEKSDFAIRAPMVYVIPKGLKHRLLDTPRRPLSLYGICLQSPRFPGKKLIESVCNELRMEDDPRRMQRIESWLRQLLAEERLRQPNYEDAQLCLVTWIMLELARTPRNDSIHISKSQHRVQSYIASLEQEFWKNEDIDSVARTLGLSRRRFTQLFRQLADESWQKRVTRLRMNYAADLLRNTTLSIRSVVFECGYQDLSHFYRVFKQTHGSSPGIFRSDS